MQNLLFGISIDHLVRVVLSTAGIFIAVITYTRIAGLRSFSKMSGFDFAMTVAVGSLIATTAVAQIPFITGLAAMSVLYILQVSIALLRRHKFFKLLVDNQPVLLLKDGQMLPENMKNSRITQQDLLSKLREANVADVKKVHAVVLETTGDVSVMHGNETLDESLLEGVEGCK